jgi:flavin reductase
MPGPPDSSLRDRYDQAMDEVATAVAVITSHGRGGSVGQTTNALMTVPDDPPTVLACVEVGSPVAAALAAHGSFRVNYLAVGHDDVSDAFAGRREDDAEPQGFTGGDWDEQAPGGPALRDAVASLECRVTGLHERGTHVVAVGEVADAAHAAAGDSLLRVRGTYRRVEELPLPVFPTFAPARPCHT